MPSLWLLVAFIAFTMGEKPIKWKDVKSPEVEKMREGFQILEDKYIKDHSLGVKASEEMLSALKKKPINWFLIAQTYKNAQWNLIWSESDPLRVAIDDILGSRNFINKVGLDIGKLGFGWRPEHASQTVAWLENRKKLLMRLRQGENLEITEILDGLIVHHPQTGKALTDERPHCIRVQEVGELLAEALELARAHKVIRDGCAGDITLQQVGRLLGFYSQGIKAVGVPEKQMHTIENLLRKLHENAQENRKVDVWAAGALSLLRAVDQAVQKTKPVVKNLTESLAQFSKYLPKPWWSVGQEKLSELLAKCNREDYRHLLPIIMEAFQEKLRFAKNNLYSIREAYHFFVNNLVEYYKKDGDMWGAWQWWEEANKLTNGEVESRWMHTLRDKISIDARQSLRMLLQSQEKPNQEKMQQVLDKKNVNVDDDDREETMKKLMEREANERTAAEAFEKTRVRLRQGHKQSSVNASENVKTSKKAKKE